MVLLDYSAKSNGQMRKGKRERRRRGTERGKESDRKRGGQTGNGED